MKPEIVLFQFVMLLPTFKKQCVEQIHPAKSMQYKCNLKLPPHIKRILYFSRIVISHTVEKRSADMKRRIA